MSKRSMPSPARLALLGLALLASSCGFFPGTFSDHPLRDGRFVALGAEPVAMLLTLPEANKGASNPVPLRAEPSSTGETLLAVALGEGAAYAAGEHGVLLHRGPREAWRVEPSGTDHTLRALAVAAPGGPRSVDGEQEEAPVFAVGDGGTVLRRSAAGTWRSEPSSTGRDLYAVWAEGALVVAAGERGTLIARRATGIWDPIPAHTEADLRRIVARSGNRLLVGAREALIVCDPWKDRADLQSICAPLVAPDLEASEAFEALITTGARGELRVREGYGSGPLALPPLPDLRAVAMNGTEAFFVGDRGRILHAQIAMWVEMYAVQQ
ncbi:MAG: hypothetical protein ABI193_15855 [Minicystis sp.]